MTRATAIITITCGQCGRVQPPIAMSHHQLLAWRQGYKIQEVLPDETPAVRELLISGTCDTCFTRMFPPE